MRTKYHQHYKIAIEDFSDAIHTLIEEAHGTKSPRERMAIAKAIVSTRDSMRENLSNLSQLLNSDIDSLSNLLDKSDNPDKDFSKELGINTDHTPKNVVQKEAAN